MRSHVGTFSSYHVITDLNRGMFEEGDHPE